LGANQHPSSNEKALLNLANDELRKKEKLIRNLKSKVEVFEGRNIENKNQKDLNDAAKVLNESLKKVQNALDN